MGPATRVASRHLLGCLRHLFTRFGSTAIVGSAGALRSGSCIRIVAASTTTIPTTCIGGTISPRMTTVKRIAQTGSRQAVTMARVGSRCCTPAKYSENGGTAYQNPLSCSGVPPDCLPAAHLFSLIGSRASSARNAISSNTAPRGHRKHTPPPDDC